MENITDQNQNLSENPKNTENVENLENSEYEYDDYSEYGDDNSIVAAEGSPDSNHLIWYLDQINKIPLLTREEEDNLARLSKDGDEEAKNKLIKANLRFVVSIAKKYQTSGISFLDIIDEGNMGLIKAADKFDPDRGVHFITYAVWWIRQSIIQAISQKFSLIRIPLSRNADLQKIKAMQKQLEEKLCRTPTAHELAEELDMDEEEISYLKNISQEMLSLDMKLGESDGSSIINIVEDKNVYKPDKKILDESLKEALHAVLVTLTESEKSVLEMRFGLNGNEPMSFQQIGDQFNLSKERISQIEKKAIRRLRHSSIGEQLKDYLV